MDMAEVTSNLVDYEIALRSALRLAKRLGLPEEVNQAIAQIQQTIRIVHQLQMAYNALLLARLSSGDPLAWVQAGIYVASSVVTMTDVG
jgi:transcription initiation factor TFIIIB Brf1 subunit/transcription initiation factor TFIIB